MKAKTSNKQELTLEEIEERYVGEWVLVEETAWDEHGYPTKCVVVAHGLDRKKIVEPTSRLHMQKLGVKSFVFYAGPKVPEGLVVVL